MKIRVAVLGAGSWGTTFASLAAHNAETVVWSRDADLADEINEHHRNGRYLPSFTLHPALRASSSLSETVASADVLVMGECKQEDEARYVHGEYGKGTWTFYSGHDPEDYQHQVYDPPTDLSLHPNSPGYRLILNNILFPAAKKKKQKT